MGLQVKWDITYKCNLMCEHCINGAYLDNGGNELTLDEIKDIVHKIHDNNTISRIHFLGGEPLVRKDFIDILEFLDELGISFGFNSNGLLLSDANMDRICKLSNLDLIILSIEGATEESNDTIRGKKVFEVLMRRLSSLKQRKAENPDANFKVGVNTVLMVNNQNEISDIISLCEAYHVDILSLLEFIDDGNGEGSGFGVSLDEMMEVIALVAEYHSRPDHKVEIVPKFARPMAIDYARECLGMSFPAIEHQCGAGATMMFLDNRGNMFACDRERAHTNYKYPMTECDYWDVWEREDFRAPFSRYFCKETYSNLEPCNDCKYLMEDCFPCHLTIDSKTHMQMSQCVYMKKKIMEAQS